MKKSKHFCFIFIVATLLIALPSLNAQSKRAQKFVVSYDRFGPVKIGMTLPQATKALGVQVTRDSGYEGNDCYYASPKGGFKGIAFMMSGQRVVRIDIDSRDYMTDKGAKIGDSETRIKRLYKGLYKVSKHFYTNGNYIEVKMRGGNHSIIFETDGKRVTYIRAGRSPEVGYVEGCS